MDFGILLLIFLDIYITSIWVSESTDEENDLNTNASLKILSKREEDLKLLEDYIDKFNIVGLNGTWGSGKSFLVNQYKEKFKEEYEFIEIDLLTINLNEV
ncbi:P-loop NTPase fold protein, partial [Vibrio diabolicus]|uniref:P-loop NTPase fold protein n=1 Tax=Vibrio diabolicus TaxID=50719 RepID=UPI00211AECB0